MTCGLPDAPAKVSALYAEDAVFWGTVSEGVRDTPQLVRDYFVSAGLLFFRSPSRRGAMSR